MMTSKLYTSSMNTTKKPQESISELKRRRTANRNTVLVMALLFVALLSGASATSTANKNLNLHDKIWGVFSVLAFAALIWSLLVAYKQADERQKLIQLKATSMTFVAVIFSLVSAQILHALNVVALSISVQFIVIGGIVLWTVLTKEVERRSN